VGNPAAITPADSANLDQPGNQSFYYHKDHQGSVRALTNDAGAVVNSYDYDSYGNIKSSTETVPQPFRYTGQQYDAGAKLYYYRHRTYDPVTGRFLQEDPLWFGAGDLNTYRYVFNNPVNLTDPMGLSPAVNYGLLQGAGIAVAGATVQYGIIREANRRSISISGDAGAGYIVACTTQAIATYFGALLNGEQNIGMLDACNAGGQGVDDAGRKISPLSATPPPGDCGPGDQRRLQDDVNRYCKTRKFSCNQTMKYSVLLDHAQAGRNCMNARNRINNKCFAGGDATHRNKALEALGTVNRCEKLLWK